MHERDRRIDAAHAGPDLGNDGRRIDARPDGDAPVPERELLERDVDRGKRGPRESAVVDVTQHPDDLAHAATEGDADPSSERIVRRQVAFHERLVYDDDRVRAVIIALGEIT